jgi:hypothetical protein
MKDDAALRVQRAATSRDGARLALRSAPPVAQRPVVLRGRAFGQTMTRRARPAGLPAVQTIQRRGRPAGPPAEQMIQQRGRSGPLDVALYLALNLDGVASPVTSVDPIHRNAG